MFDESDALYLICTSTYGSGDVPDNGRHLYDSLDQEPKWRHRRPELTTGYRKHW